jgi:hypothetical protein
MNNNQNTDQQTVLNNVEPSATPENKPDDSSGIYYSTVIKITDPGTGAVLLHTRGE